MNNDVREDDSEKRLRQHRTFSVTFGGLLWLVAAGLVLFGALTLVPIVTSEQAEANGCNGACLAEYNRCRIQRNGAASCDAQFRACVRRCIRR